MLSPKTQYSLKNAKAYFEEHLRVGDYYSEGKQVAGQWFGEGARLLGLSGEVEKETFLRLCDNLHPRSGEHLTLRQKSTRRESGSDGNEHEVANRRVFYDFTLSPPKSVSILAFVGEDRRILAAHHHATTVAMRELERFATTRVRRGASSADRLTGNVVGAVFRHDTSRALDPHLHSHCILFNATRDLVENRWKALQNYGMLRAQKYVEAVYYHELARALRRFGYEIEDQPRGDFEIKGISRSLCERFSKRHTEIDQQTAELLASEPEKANGNLADIREHVAHKERSRKIKDVATAKLKPHWTSQLSANEQAAVSALLAAAQGQKESPQPGDVQAALTWAEDHLFDRKSVVDEHELWRHALEHARGCDVEIAAVRAATSERDYIRGEENRGKFTIRKVLEREWDVLQLAKEGVGGHHPLNAGHSIVNEALDPEQRRAVDHILRSRDFLTLFRGAAGTGKSFTLLEVYRGLETGGHGTHVIAPQRQQVIDLERDGFSGAQTVSEFLAKAEMQRGAVVIVDEAGQLGAKQMQRLLRYVKANGGRVIAAGDTRQHGAVEASDALRAIEKYSGLRAAELSTIRRQDPERAKTEEERKFIEQYKQAVKEASEGKIEQSFDRLAKQGALIECAPGEQQEQLARHCLELIERGQSSVVVAQTWSEIRRVNEVVRSELKTRKLVGGEEHMVAALERIDLTDAQKRESRFHGPDRVIVFNQDAGGFAKGQSGRFSGVTSKGLVIESEKKIGTVALRHLDRVTVCRKADLALANGDRLQLKANGRTRDGRRLANGELVTVEKVGADGRIVLRDGRTLEHDYRQFVRGYAVTSYASQGKTVDYVLFSDSAVRAATNRQQWYVTISRGRKGIRIFTNDKTQLRENVARPGERELAVELAPSRLFPQNVRRTWARGMKSARLFVARLGHQFRALTAARLGRSHRQTAAP